MRFPRNQSFLSALSLGRQLEGVSSWSIVLPHLTDSLFFQNDLALLLPHSLTSSLCLLYPGPCLCTPAFSFLLFLAPVLLSFPSLTASLRFSGSIPSGNFLWWRIKGTTNFLYIIYAYSLVFSHKLLVISQDISAMLTCGTVLHIPTLLSTSGWGQVVLEMGLAHFLRVPTGVDTVLGTVLLRQLLLPFPPIWTYSLIFHNSFITLIPTRY